MNGSINNNLINKYINNELVIEKKFNNKKINYERELFFYKYIDSLGLNKLTPRLISYSPDSIILEYIQGDKLDNLNSDHILEILSFIKIINLKMMHEKIPFHAQESVLNAFILISNLKKRICQIKTENNFIYEGKVNIIENFINYYQYEIEKFCVGPIYMSPSDLGLHNILIKSKKLIFFDFEYSGLDSVLKLLYDFYLHPANKFDINKFSLYITSSCSFLGIDEKLYSNLILKVFCAWWILRLINSLSSKSIANRIKIKTLNSNKLYDFRIDRNNKIDFYWGVFNGL